MRDWEVGSGFMGNVPSSSILLIKNSLGEWHRLLIM